MLRQYITGYKYQNSNMHRVSTQYQYYHRCEQKKISNINCLKLNDFEYYTNIMIILFEGPTIIELYNHLNYELWVNNWWFNLIVCSWLTTVMILTLIWCELYRCWILFYFKSLLVAGLHFSFNHYFPWKCKLRRDRRNQ